MSWERVERVLGQANLQKLAQSKVCIVGLGSGGGFVAVSLAMSGVGEFVLVDDDLLEDGNIIRHIADRRDIGRNKAEAVGDLIRARNPQAKVTVHAGRIEQHMDALDGCDLLVVGVDGENAKYTLNSACLERNLTAVYAGVYERGEGGDVVVIRPFDGPCYACWAQNLRDTEHEAVPTQELDYGMVGKDGTLEAEPGLWVHVVKVAGVQTDFVLNELLKEARPPYPANTLIMTNTAMEIMDGIMSQPHTGVWVNIPRDPYCLVCGDQMNADQATDATPFSLDDLANDLELKIEQDSDNASNQQEHGARTEP